MLDPSPQQPSTLKDWILEIPTREWLQKKERCEVEKFLSWSPWHVIKLAESHDLVLLYRKFPRKLETFLLYTFSERIINRQFLYHRMVGHIGVLEYTPGYHYDFSTAPKRLRPLGALVDASHWCPDMPFCSFIALIHIIIILDLPSNTVLA